MSLGGVWVASGRRLVRVWEASARGAEPEEGVGAELVQPHVGCAGHPLRLLLSLSHVGALRSGEGRGGRRARGGRGTDAPRKGGACGFLACGWSARGAREGARGREERGGREERARRRLLRLCARVVDQELGHLAERVPLLPRVDDQPAAARLRGAHALLDAVDEPEPAGARVGACARKRRGWQRGAEASRDSALEGRSSARRRRVSGEASRRCV